MSLEGCRPQDHKELNTTAGLSIDNRLCPHGDRRGSSHISLEILKNQQTPSATETSS